MKIFSYFLLLVLKQFKGEFKLSSGSKKPLDKKRNEEIKPFIQCVTETVL
ncbi:hypothetical protein M5U04_04075 [Xenorhabdus sp. XENO-1]|nr:hypothetical protein [Xenorhabdus bovienii]MCP9267292.1 hypothetical protein [Xenorhabdus bovienii subsp. africana]